MALTIKVHESSSVVYELKFSEQSAFDIIRKNGYHYDCFDSDFYVCYGVDSLKCSLAKAVKCGLEITEITARRPNCTYDDVTSRYISFINKCKKDSSLVDKWTVGLYY